MNPYIAIAVCILILVAIFAILLIRIPAMKREMAAEEAKRQEEIKRKTIERFRPLIGTRIIYYIRIHFNANPPVPDAYSPRQGVITRVDKLGIYYIDLETREETRKEFKEFTDDLQYGRIKLIKQKRQD